MDIKPFNQAISNAITILNVTIDQGVPAYVLYLLGKKSTSSFLEVD
ncbi:hypothetical protein V7139_05765 [Neobacillus drentensis]